VRGRDVFAAFSDDLAIGEVTFDRRGGGDDLVWAALDRTACGALQRAWIDSAFGETVKVTPLATRANFPPELDKARTPWNGSPPSLG
jgi:hypothetical protein